MDALAPPPPIIPPLPMAFPLPLAELMLGIAITPFGPQFPY